MSENNTTYVKCGDYLVPKLSVPESPQIGMWGERRRRFLREHRHGIYSGLLLSGRLNAHLKEVDSAAEQMFFRRSMAGPERSLPAETSECSLRSLARVTQLTAGPSQTRPDWHFLSNLAVTRGPLDPESTTGPESGTSVEEHTPKSLRRDRCSSRRNTLKKSMKHGRRRYSESD